MDNDAPGEGAPVFRGEDDLLEKLEAWLASQPAEQTIMDVVKSGDGELLAAYVLKEFRIAAAQAVADRLDHHASSTFGYDQPDAGSAAYRVFIRIADVWALSEEEQVALLGLEHAQGLRAIADAPSHEQAPKILERLAILLDIFQAINMLLPIVERADAWMRKPNWAPLFRGRSAIDLMLDEDLAGMRKLRRYLQSHISGRGAISLPQAEIVSSPPTEDRSHLGSPAGSRRSENS